MNISHPTSLRRLSRQRHLIAEYSAVLLALLIGCEYSASIFCQGHIRYRYVRGDRYIVGLIDSRGDTIELATDRDTYMYYPDIYYHAEQGRDSIVGVHAGNGTFESELR